MTDMTGNQEEEESTSKLANNAEKLYGDKTLSAYNEAYLRLLDAYISKDYSNIGALVRSATKVFDRLPMPLQNGTRPGLDSLIQRICGKDRRYFLPKPGSLC